MSADMRYRNDLLVFVDIILNDLSVVKDCGLVRAYTMSSRKEVWFVTDRLTTDRIVRLNLATFDVFYNKGFDILSLLVSECEVANIANFAYDGVIEVERK